MLWSREEFYQREVTYLNKTSGTMELAGIEGGDEEMNLQELNECHP